jgi:hypothetical protein
MKKEHAQAGLTARALPRTLFGYIWWCSGRHQVALGGWCVLQGRIELGTVVAFISGLAKVNDPWGDLVNWFRDMTVNRVKYRLVADVLQRAAN